MKVVLDARLYDALRAAGLADDQTRRVTALEGVQINRVEQEEVRDRG